MSIALIEVINRLKETGLSNDEACMLVSVLIEEHNKFMTELERETE